MKLYTCTYVGNDTEEIQIDIGCSLFLNNITALHNVHCLNFLLATIIHLVTVKYFHFITKNLIIIQAITISK